MTNTKSPNYKKANKAGCTYSLIRQIAKGAVGTFFRDVDVIHRENIPAEGPVIIVANHNNQFIDAAMTLKVFNKRVISFIVAEASMHRPIIGDLARGLHAVPVIRAQDRATQGTGLLVDIDAEKQIIEGKGTSFTKQAEKGAKIALKGVAILTIDEVISDTQVKYKIVEENDPEGVEKLGEATSNSDTGLEYKVYPKINQKEVYTEVYNRLLSGGAISIFPEGGSHDQSHLLPLKAGAAVMALGAIEQGAPVRILPVGINYLSAHSFRSKVIVEIGESFEPDQVWIDSYQAGNRREAYEGLMGQIKQGLLSVTLNAPDYETLSQLRTARRLYQNGSDLDSANYLKLYRRFVDGYDKWKSEPMFTLLMDDIKLYMNHAKSIGLDDKAVRDIPPKNSCFTWIKTWNQIWISLFVIFFLFIIALPGMILNFPLYYMINKVVKKQVAKALAKSTVKRKALDVAASYKAITFVKWFPIVYLFNALVVGLLIFFIDFEIPGDEDWQIWFDENLFWLIPVLILVLLPFYTYFTLLVIESGMARIRLLPIRLRAVRIIFQRFCGGHKRLSPSVDIRLERRGLVIKTQDVISELTENDEEWQRDPIITREQMMKQRNVTLTRMVEFLSYDRQQSDLIRMQSVESDPDLFKAIDSQSVTTGKSGSQVGSPAVDHYIL